MRMRLALAAAIVVLVVGTALPEADAVNTASPRCGQQRATMRPPRATTLRVANYNVLHGLTEDPPAYPSFSTLDRRLDWSAKQIAAAGIDIVGMEEVEDARVNPPRRHADGNVAQKLAARLASLTRMTWYWCWFLSNPHFPGEPDVQTGGGGPASDQIAALADEKYASFKEGIAVLARYPIVEAEGRRLPGRVPVEALLCPPADDPTICPATVVFESRAALWAKVATPRGATQIVAAHLSHGITDASDYSSLEQAAAVLAFAEEKAAADPPARRFFVCDCNVQPTDEAPLVQFVESFGWENTFTVPCTAASADGCTAGLDVIVTRSPRRRMTERLDYVFWKPGSCASKPRPSRLFADRPLRTGTGWLWASDHLGIVTPIPVASCS